MALKLQIKSLVYSSYTNLRLIRTIRTQKVFELDMSRFWYILIFNIVIFLKLINKLLILNFVIKKNFSFRIKKKVSKK